MQNRGKSAQLMAREDVADTWRRLAIVAGHLLRTAAVPGSYWDGTP